MRSWCDEVGEEAVEEAIRLADESGKRSWGYVKGILENKRADGEYDYFPNPVPPEAMEGCSIARGLGKGRVSDIAPPEGCCGAYYSDGTGMAVACIHPEEDCVYHTHCGGGVNNSL